MKGKQDFVKTWNQAVKSAECNLESRGFWRHLKSSVTSLDGQLYTTDIPKQRTNIYVQKYNMIKDDTSTYGTPLYNGQ